MQKLTKLDTKRLKLSFAAFEDAVKIELLRIHCLPLRFHAWIHPSIKLIDFNGFLSDSVEITLCEYTKTIIHLRLS